MSKVKYITTITIIDYPDFHVYNSFMHINGIFRIRLMIQSFPEWRKNMSDGSKQFLKQDLVYILQLNSQIQYDNKHNVKQAHDMVLKKHLFKSVLGQKYTMRLEQIINGTDSSNKCALCKNSLDNPTLVCSSCLSKYKLTPADRAEAKVPEQTETGILTGTDAQSETGIPTETDTQAAMSPQTNVADDRSPVKETKARTGSIKLHDLFSDVFKRHTREESAELFIAGTPKTTPDVADISVSDTKPWLFSRVLITTLLSFGLLYICARQLQKINVIWSLILTGALALPLSALTFMYEINIPRNIGIYEVMKMFFLGGAAALLLTLFLFEAFPIGQLSYTEAIIVGFIESIGRLLAIIIFIRILNPKYILNGLLIGAAVGAGFALFETAGYAFRFYSLSGGNINYLTSILLLRTWSSAGSHAAWAAITAAGLVIAMNGKPFNFKCFADIDFIKFFFIPVILHSVWDCPFMDSGSVVYIKLAVLIAIAWIIIFAQFNKGLSQIKAIQTAP